MAFLRVDGDDLKSEDAEVELILCFMCCHVGSI